MTGQTGAVPVFQHAPGVEHQREFLIGAFGVRVVLKRVKPAPAAGETLQEEIGRAGMGGIPDGGLQPGFSMRS